MLQQGEGRAGAGLAAGGAVLAALAIALSASEFTADVGPESMRVTTLGGVGSGSLVNLERPLRPDSRMGGHFVQGHVDAVGTLVSLEADQDFHWMTVRFPESLARYMVAKGSVTVDGISLTIARLGADEFEVQLVPFTMGHTNLQRAKAGDPVNLECDMIGKYVARAIELHAARPGVTP